MKTRFILIRHAQSAAKERGIVQGRGLAVPLTREGEAQSRKLAAGLKIENLDRIFSSTALRARKTAEPIRTFYPHLPYEEISELNERSKGAAEGINQEEFARRYPQVIEAWAKGFDPRPAGGESLADVYNRAVPIIENHKTQYGGKTLLYVTHGNVIRLLLVHMLGLSPALVQDRIFLDYCGVSLAEYDHEKSRWYILYVNKTIY